jgi:preprotein translocase subunit SecD
VRLRTRAIWVVIAVLFSAFLAFPSLYTPEERMESGLIPDNGINLGLDLQGGVHWLLSIDVPTAVRQELERSESDIKTLLADRQVEEPRFELLEEGALVVEGSPQTLDTVRGIVNTDLTSLEVIERNGSLQLRLTDTWNQEVVRRGVRQAQEVLRKRIDGLGVTEPVIAPQGEGRILVQLPGGDVDPAEARKILEQTTFLEFKHVRDAAPNEELLLDKYPEGLPEETMIVLFRGEGDVVAEALLVPERPALTGALLEDARLGFDRRNRAIVSFTWNSEGARLFREFTGEHVGERLAAIVDGVVVTAPVIQDRIGRQGQITGRFTEQEAANLAVALRSGALPIPLVIEEERTVGPSLGADSIRRGIRSILVGGAVVVLFMVAYYRVGGALANVALFVNLVIIIGVMGLAGATLTLPGIAGLVMPVGMAVDANVIIFERIREELRSGKSVRNSVDVGFRRSALTILDANITTLITAIVLFYFGSGPIQGFAVTLSVGIFSSVFCALVVTRLMVDLLLERGPRALRI